MVKRSSLTLALLLFGLAACGGPNLAAVGNERGAGLSAQELAVGQCGLFLWGRTDGRPLQLFQNVTTGALKLAFIDGEQQVRVTRQARPIVDRFYADQGMVAGEVTIDIDLRPEAGRNLVRGIKIPKGQIAVMAPDGTRTLIAVTGLFGCRT